MTATSRTVIRLGILLLVVLAFLAALAQGTGSLADLVGRAVAAAPANELEGNAPLAPAPGGPIPHAFWGAVTLNGSPAPVGTKIEAKGANVTNGIQYNPLTTIQAGQYGEVGPLTPKLVVQGDDNLTDGTPLRFYVNDMRAECQPEGGAWGLTYPFAQGDTTQLNLRLVSPVLRISKLNSTTARLSWDAVGGAVSYALYRSTTPYFTPADPPYQTVVGLSYDDVGALGNSGVNYFYQLKAVYDDGKGMASNRVGEFDFSLTPGS